MAVRRYAKVTVQAISGLVVPAPIVVTLEIRRVDNDALDDCDNARLRMQDPRGFFTTIVLQHVATGIYRAGSAGDLVVTVDGATDFRGDSLALADEVRGDTETIVFASDGFSDVSGSGSGTGATDPTGLPDGTYTNPTLTVVNGRIAAIATGSGGGGGGPPVIPLEIIFNDETSIEVLLPFLIPEARYLPFLTSGVGSDGNLTQLAFSNLEEDRFTAECPGDFEGPANVVVVQLDPQSAWSADVTPDSVLADGRQGVHFIVDPPRSDDYQVLTTSSVDANGDWIPQLGVDNKLPNGFDVPIIGNFTGKVGAFAPLPATRSVATPIEVTIGPPGSGAAFEVDGLNLNDSPIFQKALNAAAANFSTLGARGCVRIYPGRYYLGTEPDWPDSVKVKGSGRNVTKLVITNDMPLSAHGAVGCIGGIAATPQLVIADLVEGSTVLRFATGTDLSMYTRDSMFKLISDDLFEPTENDGRRLGEFKFVAALGADRNGTGASIVAIDTVDHLVTLTGLSGFDGTEIATDGTYSRTITIGGAANSAHNGTFHLHSVPSPTSIVIFNKSSAAAGSDANNGALTWSGPTISVFGMCRDNYRVAANVRILALAMKKDVGISDLSVEQAAPDGTRDGTPPQLAFRYCLRPEVKGCFVANNDGPALVFQDCYGHQAFNNRLGHLWDYSANKQYGYGILQMQCSETGLMWGNHIERCRHGFDTGNLAGTTDAGTNYGVARNNLIHGNCVTHATDAAYSTHAEGEGNVYSSCIATDCDNVGFYMRGKGSVITGALVEGCSGGFTLGSNTTSVRDYLGSNTMVLNSVFRKLRAIQTASSDLFETGSGGGGAGGIGALLNRVRGCVVKGNVFESCDGPAMVLRPGADDNLIADNEFIDCCMAYSSYPAVRFDDSGSGTLTTSVQSGGVATLTALTSSLTGLNAAHVGALISPSGATNPGNNGTFRILSVISPTSCTIANSGAVAESGIPYKLQGARNNKFESNKAWNRSTRQLGSVAHITAVANGMATVTGLSGMSATSIDLLLNLTNPANPLNQGPWPIAEVLSSSSVKILNPNAVVDAGSIAWTAAKNFSDRNVTPGRMTYMFDALGGAELNNDFRNNTCRGLTGVIGPGLDVTTNNTQAGNVSLAA